MPSGETSKSLEMLEQLIEAALEAGLDRNSTVVASAAASSAIWQDSWPRSYMRGISFVQIPTTILAHDSSVGGKVAVNHRAGQKYYRRVPSAGDRAVSIWIRLRTLPKREVRAGLSEVVKHGLIWNAEFVALVRRTCG